MEYDQAPVSYTHLDSKNNVRGKETVITTDDSKVKALLIPTDEELMIAREMCIRDRRKGVSSFR